MIMGWHNSNFDGLSEHQLGQAVGNSWPLGVAQKLFDDSQLHLKLSRRAENPFCLNANALPFHMPRNWRTSWLGRSDKLRLTQALGKMLGVVLSCQV